jgi:hypothetical protein
MWNGVLQQTTLLPPAHVHSRRISCVALESGTPVGFALHLQNTMGDSQKKWRWMLLGSCLSNSYQFAGVWTKSMLRQKWFAYSKYLWN